MDILHRFRFASRVLAGAHFRVPITWSPGESRNIKRRRPLTQQEWEPNLVWGIDGAIAALQVMRGYWTAAFAHYDFIVVRHFDNGLYAMLYHDLFLMLEMVPGLERISREIKLVVPDRLPNHGDADRLGEIDIRKQEDAFIEAVGALERAAVQVGISLYRPEAAPITELFEMFTGEIGWFRETALQQCIQITAQAPQEPHVSQIVDSPHTSQIRRAVAGRKPVQLNYETAQHAYWYISDALETAGESRRPSQQDVVDNLTESGNAVSKSTFGRFVREWKGAGQQWPPPRPNSHE